MPDVSGVKLSDDGRTWLENQFAPNKKGRPHRKSIEREILRAVYDALPAVADE